MNRRAISTGKKATNELTEALAVLISCTLSKKRPLPLTEIARWLDVAVRHLGSYSAVADRIGLSSTMLRQFAAVRRLAPPVQAMFRERRLDSVDAAVHLAMLSPADQKVVAESLADGEMDTGDIRAVVQLRRSGAQSRAIKDLLKRVTESKARREYVAEFVIRGPRDRRKLLTAFEAFVPADDILALEVNGSVGRLVLTPNGKKALGKAAKDIGVSLRRVIPSILQGSYQS